MAQPFFDHPYFRGHHTPMRIEADAPDLFVHGDLPDDLAGIFYRNGPESLYPPREGDYHWFDGDGMIYAFEIGEGRVSMRNRWVRTEKFELEKQAGRRLFGIFGNPMTGDPSVAGKRYNTGNTNIIVHGGKLLALMEGAPPVEMDPRSLATRGEEHYGHAVTTTFGAHPTIDQTTGEMFNVSSMINGPFGAKEMRYDIINADGTLQKSEVLPVPHMALLHTFFLTENWTIIPVIPIDTDIERAQKGGPMTAWVEGRPTKFGLMPRYGSASDLRWFEYEPRHMFHELNVWEDAQGRIVADVAAADCTALFPTDRGRQLTHADARQNLRRWTIDPHGNTSWMKEEVLNERDIQFPRPDDRLMSRASRQAFANINLHSKDGRVDGMDAVLRYDTVTGQEDIYHFGDGASAGELIFAPRLGGTEEGDGYALTLVHRANSPISELAVFAAMDIASGPIATVEIPFRVPSGFHCNFYAADSALYGQALGTA